MGCATGELNFSTYTQPKCTSCWQSSRGRSPPPKVEICVAKKHLIAVREVSGTPLSPCASHLPGKKMVLYQSFLQPPPCREPGVPTGGLSFCQVLGCTPLPAGTSTHKGCCGWELWSWRQQRVQALLPSLPQSSL